MANPTSPDERRKLLWARVYQELLQYAIPDSRFNLDFLSFTPDFRNSSAVVERIADLPCYQSAVTILVSPDNSLEQFRHRALKDGKRVLVATYRLRRGFVLLDPVRISDENLELAACLDGMEKPGLGRAVSLAQIRDEGLSIDMCATGGLAFNEQGVVIWEGHGLFEVQWALLHDIKALAATVPVVAVAHTCQVINEEQLGVGKIKAEKAAEVQCDFVVTPERVFETAGAFKPRSGIDFNVVDKDALNNIPPLQELKGIQMMEQIMRSGHFGTNKEEKPAPSPPTAEEELGRSIVDRLLKGHKFPKRSSPDQLENRADSQ